MKYYITYLKKHKRISEYDSENLAFSVIEDILKQEKFKSVRCSVHPSLATLVKNHGQLSEEEARYAENPLTGEKVCEREIPEFMKGSDPKDVERSRFFLPIP